MKCGPSENSAALSVPETDTQHASIYIMTHGVEFCSLASEVEQCPIDVDTEQAQQEEENHWSCNLPPVRDG